jgi:hypothetical protein
MVNRRQPREKVTAEVPLCVKRDLWQGKRIVEGIGAAICYLLATAHYFRTQAGLTEPR